MPAPQVPGPPMTPPPGWYRDPEHPRRRRWWDGVAWSAHVAPAAAGPRVNPFAVAALVLGILGQVLFALPFAFVARSQVKRSDGAQAGMGLANAGIGLSLAWLVGITTVVVLGISGAFESENAERYSGELRAVAQMVDDVEAAFSDEDGERLCNQLFTAGFAARIAAGSDEPCVSFIEDADGVIQEEIDIKAISIAYGVATVDVEEGDDPQRWRCLRFDGQWRVDHIDTSP